MRWIILFAGFLVFFPALWGCAVYGIPQDVKLLFQSGKTMEVKVVERVGIFGQDWFVGGAELCDPALEGKCVVQIFHGHGGALANHAAYGAVGAAILAPAIRDSGTEVHTDVNTDVDQKVRVKQEANPRIKVQPPQRRRKY